MDEFCFMILLFSLIITLILSISFVSRKHTSHKSIKSIFSLLDDNFNFPIYSIKLANIENECDDKYLSYQIGYYPGTKKGIYFKNKVKKGKSCTLLRNCETISETSYLPIYIWDGNKFCIKNKKELKYENLIRNSVKYGNECEIGYKKCGILDSNNRILCVENIADCPINKIIINNNLNPPNDYSYTSLSLNNNKYLHYTNEAIDNPIVVNISISLGNYCYDPYELNTQYPQYILDYNFNRYFCSHKNNDSFFDNSSILIDSITKSQVYYENKIDLLINELKGYPLFSLNEKYGLYFRNYYGIDFNCINDKNINMNDITKFNKWNNLSKKLNILCIVLSTFMFVFGLFLCFNCLSFPNANFLYFSILNWINIFMEIMILILGLISFLYLDKINLTLYCFEKVKGYQLYKIKNNLQYEKRVNIIYIIISGIIIIIFITNAFFFALEKKEYERNNYVNRIERRIIFRNENLNNINEEENNNL